MPGQWLNSQGSQAGRGCALRLENRLLVQQNASPYPLFPSSTENTPMIAGLGKVSG